ncbi:MAG: hypothetical protein NVSMB49_29180 [Ktedonobacteraceae bacterium]
MTGKPFKDAILAISPWLIEDPDRVDSHLSLEQRRILLKRAGTQLLLGGKNANMYPESVICADI